MLAISRRSCHRADARARPKEQIGPGVLGQLPTRELAGQSDGDEPGRGHQRPSLAGGPWS